MNLRLLAVPLLAFALAACGQPAGKQGETTTTAEQQQKGETDAVVLGSTQRLPDWLFVARQRDCITRSDGERECNLGEVHFNQRTITRSGETADIWIQVRHAYPQLFEYETETHQTSVRFEVERLHYRFNCTSNQFIVVERQIMGPGDTIAARDEPRAIYRAPVQGSVTGIIQPIACRGS